MVTFRKKKSSEHFAFLGMGLLLPLLLTLLALVHVDAVPLAATFGAYDPVFTPFTSNGTLDIGAIAAYASYSSAAGTSTIILGGSTGEWPSMTTDERISTLIAWRAAIDALPPRVAPLSPRPLLMFHVGDTAVHRAVQLAAASRQHGADSVLIVCAPHAAVCARSSSCCMCSLLVLLYVLLPVVFVCDR